MDAENRVTAVRGQGVGDWIRNVRELSKEKQKY